MKVRNWILPLLGFTAFGCGVDQKLLGPGATSSNALRSRLAATSGASSSATPGAVYTMTNATTGNAVLAFGRGADGTLGAPQSYSTGGTGSGAGLGNQGALALGNGNRSLYVVNAGSNDVSAFRVGAAGLELVNRVASGGDHPVSVTAHHDLVYVLNAGGTGNIQGFRVSSDGSLSAIAGSNKPLSSSDAGAAQIGFTPDGTALVVSEKATNTLSVFRVASDGSATGPVAMTSSGPTPYGFGFDQTGTLVVSEAFGGGAGASAVSSYAVSRGGAISLVSGSVPTNQTAACWIAVQGDGRFAYAANAGSGSLTGYSVANDGSLTRVGGAPTTTASGPTEMCFSNGSRFLYVLSPGSRQISGYAVAADGSLAAIAPMTDTPMGLNGLVSR